MWQRRRFFGSHFTGFTCVLTVAYASLAWTPSFFVRAYQWPIARVGVVLAIFNITAGLISFAISGQLVDRWVKTGRNDAHFRFYVWASLLLVLCGAPAYLAPRPWLWFIGASLAAVPLNMAAVAASAIQVVTPQAFRGRVSAIYMLVVVLVAQSIGPVLPAFLTVSLPRGLNDIGTAVGLTFALMGPLALIAFATGLAPMRRALSMRT